MAKIEPAVKATKPCWLISMDIKKAYDNISLDVLDKMITENCTDNAVLYEWKEELADLKDVNIGFSNQIIYRTKGLPQGSELAPFLFNYFTTCMVNNEDVKQILSQFQCVFYADNWILISYAQSRNTIDAYISLLRQIIFANYNLEFNESDIHINKVSQMATFPVMNQEVINNPINPYIRNEPSEKLLGIPFIVIDETIFADIDSLIFTIKYHKVLPPHKAFKMLKKYYVPKYRYYHQILSIWDPGGAQYYRRIFRNECRRWLMQKAVMLKVPNEMLDHLIDNTNKDVMANYYFFWATKFKNMPRNDEDSDTKQGLIDRWWWLAMFIEKYRIYLGIYSISNYIQNAAYTKPINYFWNMDLMQMPTRKQIIRTCHIMDSIYYCIMTNQQIEAFVTKDLENKMMQMAPGKYEALY